MGAIALSYPSYCYWWLIMKKRSWKLYCSVALTLTLGRGGGVRKCNSANKWLHTGSYIFFIRTSTVISKYVSWSQSKTGWSLFSFNSKAGWNSWINWTFWTSPKIWRSRQRIKLWRLVKFDLFTYLFFLFLLPLCIVFQWCVPKSSWLLFVCLSHLCVFFSKDLRS